ncbi:MAG: phage virion morphogenesis protein [Rhizobiaceae bacterium]|nr:phage virion morphogenesis protein [Rhizobiaceae bacterium]
MSVSIEVTQTGLPEALLKIEGMADAPKGELMEGIARLVQEQTRRRIEVEKTSPAGEPWKKNWKGSSTLYESGALSRSIDYAATETTAEIGTGIVYGRIHQLGGTIKPKSAKALAFMMGNRFVMTRQVTMPARPYLGLSAENERDIIQDAEDWLERLVE